MTLRPDKLLRRCGRGARRRALAFLGLALVASISGCGNAGLLGSGPDYPNALVDDAGREIHLATVRVITEDADLTDAEKRDRLEELGITDEDVQDYLLASF